MVPRGSRDTIIGRRGRALAALVLAACWTFGCGGDALRLARRPQRPMDFILVQRPPPIVSVDVQPSWPSPAAVWVPGSWSWRAAGWVWNPGAWVVPAPGASWSPWTWSYQPDGQVRFWEARWFGSDGQPMEAPPALVPVRDGAEAGDTRAPPSAR